MKMNWNFLGGGGVQNKKPSMGEYGYFLELHVYNIYNHGFNRKLSSCSYAYALFVFV